MTAASLVAALALSACHREPTSAAGTGAVPDAPAVISPSGPIPCGDLRTLSLPNTSIAVAESVAAGAFVPPADGPRLPALPDAPPIFQGLPPFCRVGATIRPVPGSAIRFDVWMPAQWNGKFVGVGNGGAAGFIFHADMAEPLRRGYAVASSDTGHSGGMADWTFAVQEEKRIDYGWRATHEMTVQAKALVAAHYGKAARLSYWTGCSSGGRQGLVEARRFPADYDGIVAGAPANNLVLEAARSILLRQATTDPVGALTVEKLGLVSEAALAACDAADGVRDRTVTHPLSCTFDPDVLRCTAGDEPSCLTSRQVDWVRRIYRGLVDPRTGARAYPGVLPGSERDWVPPPFAAETASIGENYFRDVVFRDPNWDVRAFDAAGDVDRAQSQDNGVIAMTDPDLRVFLRRGGRLLMWHGWSDGAISPLNSIDYYEAVLATNGAPARNQVRLFMAPGVNHCGGGEGPSQVSYLSALEQWVEHGRTPDRITAGRPLANGVTRTRPLCAYPHIASYRGTGSTDEAGSFVCQAP